MGVTITTDLNSKITYLQANGTTAVLSPADLRIAAMGLLNEWRHSQTQELPREIQRAINAYEREAA